MTPRPISGPVPGAIPLCLIVLLFWPGAGLEGRQEEGETSTEDTLSEEGMGDEDAFGDLLEPAPSADVDELLYSELEVLAGEGTTYDPGDRRDPFVSLLEPDRRLGPPPCPPDILACIPIDEIDITGVFITADGPVAQVRTTRSKRSFLLRQGDHLWDGQVVSITRSEVLFRQIDNDPTNPKPFREVVKKLDS